MSHRDWDEYEWERFLQEQDRKTEKYLELSEKYLDHPNRDQIIAREMGWDHLEDTSKVELTEWMQLDSEKFDGFISVQGFAENNEGNDTCALFEEHLLYQRSTALTQAVDRMFADQPPLQNNPAAVKLATHVALGSAKLAAAMSDDYIDEMGMTVAYLKRALRSVTISLEAVQELQTAGQIDPPRGSLLSNRVFQLRDGIISEMGRIRAEWRNHRGK